jgi:hypothetical protein
VFRDSSPITPAEASAGRCQLCHRKLLAHPRARIQDVERLGDEWGAAMVHRSCAVLAGLHRLSDPASPRNPRNHDRPQPVV